MRTAPILLALPLSTLLLACPSEPEEETHVCGDLDRALVAPGDPAPEGLGAADEGDLEVTMISADPAVPDVGNNVWEVSVTDAAGTPQAGCTATVVPFMPDHGHGITEQPTWTESTTEVGVYTIDNMDWIMPGYWEVTIQDLTCGATGPEDPIFGFCAEN